ncbi:hypothetical protein GALMADRAFT_1364660 [Galerina marginata CBS 339.88]|uniref:Uncharacterized protein n=1 Tax=Galerina marginata (strain CBS 339.88) TaxID=685588 RepID=A0A067T822_GALM3|nr:hypothetical protein GALMADRAFT_1364660 [Galerina marginata CBS 339.88]
MQNGHTNPRSAPHPPIPQSEPSEPSPKSLLVHKTNDILPFRNSLLTEYARPPYGLGLSEEQVRRVREMSLEAQLWVGNEI